MAKMINLSEILESYLPGQYIWGAFIASESRVYGGHPHAEPAYGMLALGKTEIAHQARMTKYNGKFPNAVDIYFVPCKSGPDSQLNWKRAVNFTSRFYAGNKSDIWELYDTEVQRRIKWHQDKIKFLIGIGSAGLKAKSETFDKDLCASQLKLLCKTVITENGGECENSGCDDCPITKTLELLENLNS